MKKLSSVKMSICNAMLELLKTNDYNNITISKLIETAKVNRSSYYYHFYDKYEVIDCIIQYIADDIANAMRDEIGNIEELTNYDNSTIRIKQIKTYKIHFTEIRTLYSANFRLEFEDALINAFINTKRQFDYSIKYTDGTEDFISDDLIYNMKILQSTYCIMADFRFLFEQNFAMSIDEFVEMSIKARKSTVTKAYYRKRTSRVHR